MIRLTDEQWERIREHFPEEQIADGRPGRKPVPTRRVLEAVLWILNTGAQWHMLPQSYPNYKTVYRRSRQGALIHGIVPLFSRSGHASAVRQHSIEAHINSIRPKSANRPLAIRVDRPQDGEP